jgi:hypothetical protein
MVPSCGRRFPTHYLAFTGVLGYTICHFLGTKRRAARTRLFIWDGTSGRYAFEVQKIRSNKTPDIQLNELISFYRCRAILERYPCVGTSQSHAASRYWAPRPDIVGLSGFPYLRDLSSALRLSISLLSHPRLPSFFLPRRRFLLLILLPWQLWGPPSVRTRPRAALDAAQPSTSSFSNTALALVQARLSRPKNTNKTHDPKQKEWWVGFRAFSACVYLRVCVYTRLMHASQEFCAEKGFEDGQDRV